MTGPRAGAGRRQGAADSAVLLGAASVLLTSGQAWARRTTLDPAGLPTETVRTAQDLVPWAVPGTLLAVVALLVARAGWPVLRRPAHLLLALASLSVLVAVVLGGPWAAGPDGTTTWAAIGLLGALVLAGGGALGVVAGTGTARGQGHPRSGPQPVTARVERPARTPPASVSSRDAMPAEQRRRREAERAWRALDRDEDPTDAP